MTRKVATKRLEPIAGLRASIPSRGASIAHRLGQRPAAPSGAGTSYELVFEHLHDELLTLERKLKTAEGAHDDARAQFRECKRERDQARLDLGSKYRRVRRFLRGFFPSQNLSRAGLARTTSPDAPEFARMVTRTIRALGEPEALGPPILELAFDAPAMVAQLQADLERLKASVADLEAARANVVATRSLADDAIAEVDRVAPSICRCLEGLCLLAGEHLAPKQRRK